MDIDLKAYNLSKSKVETLVGKDKKYDHITGAGFSRSLSENRDIGI